MSATLVLPALEDTLQRNRDGLGPLGGISWKRTIILGTVVPSDDSNSEARCSSVTCQGPAASL